MPGFPQRQSLVTQIAAFIKAELAKGTWHQWLPNERSLADSLHVSRNTLRAALRQLASDGILERSHGLGTRIIGTANRALAARERTVCLVSPQPLEQLRPTQNLWIDELRAVLIENGCRLQVVHGLQYFRPKPGEALQKLVLQHPHACWILIRSTESTQAWFQRNREPCLVAGSCHPGVDLPFVDLDHRALCRHAAGVLLAAGHRRIALFAERTHRPGDTASELGFLEGVRASPHTDAEALVAWHAPSLESVRSALRRLFEQRRPPTALLVANPLVYLTVITRLHQMGRRIPEDVSLLSRDDDPFLSFLLPAPARYKVHAHAFARRVARPVLEMLESGTVTYRAITIMPEFVPGESLAAPPQRT